MIFLSPLFLFGLLLVAIPIVIHLFNFRRYKIVYFSNVALLKNIKQSTRSHSKLKNLLVLLMRILTIIFLIIAFAQPYIPANKEITNNQNEVISIYIDNSFSMEGENEQGKLLEVAKNKAIEIADAYKVSTKFLLLTNDFNPKYEHLVNKEQFIEFLQEIKPSHNNKLTSEIIAKHKDFINYTNQKTKYSKLYIISDFQKSTTNIEKIKDTELIGLFLLPIKNNSSKNLFVDSVWFESPSRINKGNEIIFARLVNKSDEDIMDIEAKLFLTPYQKQLKQKKELKTVANVSVPANSSQTIQFAYSNTANGLLDGIIEINDSPITYDNQFYFSYQINEKLNILLVGEQISNGFISKLFENDENINVKNNIGNNIDYSTLNNYNLLILNGLVDISSGLADEVVKYLSESGSVLVIPSQNTDINSYNNFFDKINFAKIISLDTSKTEVKTIELNDKIYKNAILNIEKNTAMPYINKHFTTSLSVNTRSIIRSRENHNLFCSANIDKGSIYFLTFPINNDCSNFTKHPIFVPTIYNIALQSQISSKLYNIIGKDKSITINNNNFQSENTFNIVALNSKKEFIAQSNIVNSLVNLNINNNIDIADNYAIENNEKQTIAIASFNYDRAESDLNFYTQSELEQILKQNNLKNARFISADDKYLSQKIKETSIGTPLWKIFIILAIISILAEILIIRYLRK